MDKVLSSRYLKQVYEKSHLLRTPAPQLLILDLNGTLVYRIKKKGMYVRPYSSEFFDFIFKHFTVMVWSSAQPQSVDFMCKAFGDHRKTIDLIWDRRSLRLSRADYHRKVQTIKDLQYVWTHYRDRFDASNTILLDDSAEKTQLQPYNCVHPSTFTHSQEFMKEGECELLHVMDYLKDLQCQSNVANYIKDHPYTRKNRHVPSSVSPYYRILKEKKKQEDVTGMMESMKINK
ncbi:HAD-like domain-containing protein [Pilobolus umbonatus]|nr:HAD-like domain-containing protein [Pilobolus umbonatus]